LPRFQSYQNVFVMKWETVSSAIGHSAYALWNNGKKLITLVFNSSSNAARIEYAGEKRVFLIRDEGFRKNKTVLRNEYGIRIGHTGTENNENFIVVNNERYFYSIDNNEPVLTIYKESKDRPLAVCGLNINDTSLLSKAGVKRPLPEKALYSMLMSLCLYMFRPAEKLEYSF